MANPKNDSPNKTYHKVDYETILKRRRRNASDYVKEKRIKTIKSLKEHLDLLRKTYNISNDFESSCRTCVLFDLLDNNHQQEEEEAKARIQQEEGKKESQQQETQKKTKPTAPGRKKKKESSEKGL